MVDGFCLVDLIWKDGLGGICRMTSSVMGRDLKDVDENYEIAIVNEVKITKYPYKWVMTLEITTFKWVSVCHVHWSMLIGAALYSLWDSFAIISLNIVIIYILYMKIKLIYIYWTIILQIIDSNNDIYFFHS